MSLLYLCAGFFFFPGDRSIFLLDPSSTNRSDPTNGDVLAKSFHDAWSDAIDLLQIVWGSKWAILLAMIHNCLGFGRANSLKSLKLRLSCSIDVNDGIGGTAKRK